MNFGAAVQAYKVRVIKELLVDLRITLFILKLARVQIAMFFGIFTAVFCHRFSPLFMVLIREWPFTAVSVSTCGFDRVVKRAPPQLNPEFPELAKTAFVLGGVSVRALAYMENRRLHCSIPERFRRTHSSES